MNKPFLRSFRLKHFKAVRDSGPIRFTPLTVFIGNNGSGKSSIVEGLETLQAIVQHDLDVAMQAWRGFEHIWHRGVRRNLRRTSEKRSCFENPMSFHFSGRSSSGAFSASLTLNAGPGTNEIFIEHEEVKIPKQPPMVRDSKGRMTVRLRGAEPNRSVFSDGQSGIVGSLVSEVSNWQFVSLVPQSMGAPVPQHRTGGQVRLNKEGANLADYLLNIRRLDQAVFDGIVETLQHVLPYAKDLQPSLTSELERTVYLQLSEANYKVPGWLLSTGTLRILAFLALFRHPSPPPLILIEELENGLDPRTLHLLVDEIRTLVESRRSQVIVTTHSPYLLDLLELSHIVMVERIAGQPTFTRPADQKALQRWARDFSPGRLYTMGLFNKKRGQ
jgi:predicted ATPase